MKRFIPHVWAACLVAVVTLPALGHLPQDPSTPAASEAPSGLQRLDEQAWDLAKARHLLFRAGLGGSAEEVARLHAAGLDGAVERLVNFEALPAFELQPPEPPQPEVPFEELRTLPAEKRMEIVNRFQRAEREYLSEVRRWWLIRMASTDRPLEEKLVLFWHGHFASDFRTVERAQAIYQQNCLFRAHAAGNFGELLHGIVHDPAMLRYLDNHRNVRGRPNENLAREIMELFTMGEGCGYTERDIAEGARALTGYNFRRDSLEFQFASRMHDPGKKTIFGQTGSWDGDDFADLILRQPATARFIARKLFVFFVHDQPSEETIDRLAALFRENNYELTPLLRNLFLSEEFYSERALGNRIKSPAELVVGTVRTLQVADPDANTMFQAMRLMGQELFNPPNVKGWEGGDAWINSNTLFVRNNFSTAIVTGLSGNPASRANRRPGNPAEARDRRGELAAGRPMAAGIDWAARLREHEATTPEQIVDALARTLLAVPLSAEKRDELVARLGDLPDPAAWLDERRAVNQKVSELLVLIMTQPEYQLN